ncbi:right-handed parallel beta-helix repeat-containing protein [Streptomyces sp. PLK6-54]|uniref:Right-handed parallel beta-helix repeat-containing protein n=2 Tax=Actinacidiphila acidipaludis TaxID=2873382 RepID=A0ABS7Q8D3_9ACTN|nr:right-handed parallel beta-helix repeat-containing protein [Streptomyces acidipaludis]
MRYGTRRPGRLAAAGVLAAAAAGTALVAAPSADAATVHVVTPGQSIQQAVDSARPGDVIQIMPGTYRESVLVTVPRLTIRGAGAQRVTLRPAAQPASTTATTKAAASCFTTGAGICVAGTDDHPVRNVRVQGLTVTGFAKYGIAASGTDRLTVTRVDASDNGMYGIGEQKSVRATFTRNRAANNGEGGIFLANTTSEEGGALDLDGARVSGNVLTGNKMGVVLRRVRDMSVQGNSVSGNCAGMFVIGDENTPRGGDLTVRGNVVTDNTKYCAANTRLPFVQGAGIVLTGVENTVVERNIVTGNSGTSVMSGGVVLFKSFVGVPNTGNTIRDNVLSGNAPADLADGDTTATGNTFTGNSCSVSLPAGRC